MPGKTTSDAVLYVYGGFNDANGVLSDFWELSMTSAGGTWASLVPPSRVASADAVLQPLVYASANELVLTGGLDGAGEVVGGTEVFMKSCACTLRRAPALACAPAHTRTRARRQQLGDVCS